MLSMGKSHQSDDDASITDARRINETADQLATVCKENVYNDLITANQKQFMEDAKAV